MVGGSGCGCPEGETTHTTTSSRGRDPDHPTTLKVGDQLDPEVCRSICPPPDDPSGLDSVDCTVDEVIGETAHLACHWFCSGAGRRPPGWQPAEAATRSTGDVLSQICELENQSIVAFEHLAIELDVHRAPSGLVRAARYAARDERQHATTMARLASRFGAAWKPSPVRVSNTVRTLAEIAEHNEVEGCVRETYGAAVAFRQAHAAADRGVRRAMRSIAVDEARHAALAWRVSRWAGAVLGSAARDRMTAARGAAVESLLVDVQTTLPYDVRRASGLPCALQATAIVRRLARGLWLPRRRSSDLI